MTHPPTSPATARPAILTPAVDLMLVGGLSMLVFIPMLLSGRSDLVFLGAGAQAWLLTLINMPHFMASYRIVYRSREMILRHKWASLYVPALLLAYMGFALASTENTRVLVVILVTVASAYLAWHYTGQVWGMMASFAYLEGARFDDRERKLIRTGLRILLAWHVAWFLYTQLRDPSRVRALYLVISAGSVVAFALGAAGLLRMRRRIGRLPPARALVAWASLFVWYAMMARDPRALFWVQLAHALQYLAFPIRVEMNNASQRIPGRGRFLVHMGLYAAVLLGLSWAITGYVPATAMGVVGDFFSEDPRWAAPILILLFINIHHYFTDGVIWKISNPEVRRELFAHVAPSLQPAPVKAGEGAVARSRPRSGQGVR